LKKITFLLQFVLPNSFPFSFLPVLYTVSVINPEKTPLFAAENVILFPACRVFSVDILLFR